MSSIDSTGISVDRLDTIREDLQELFKASFGDDIKVGADSVFGQIIENLALTLHDQNELIESVANYLNPQNASGVPLSNLVLLNGITRNPNVYSTATVTCTVNKTLTIPQGSILTDDNGIEWTTDEDLTITAPATTGDVGVTCSEEGAITAGAGTIATISSPLSGWTGVTNAAAATAGELEETDTALHLRRQAVSERASTVSTSAMYLAVSEVDGITETKVYENAETTTNSYGIPPGHIWVIVKGTFDEDELAEAIYTHRAAGIPTTGDSTIAYTDTDSGDTVNIRYTEGTPITIDVEITLSVYDATEYAADGGDSAVQTAVETFINDLEMGEDVKLTRLYTPINTIGGHTITTVQISRNPAAVATQNLAMDVDEYAVTAVGNITVTS